MNIKRISEFVYERLHHEPTGHDYLHAMRVYKNAQKLLEPHMDQDVVLVSCLIHDVIDEKLEPEYHVNEKELRDVLKQSDLSNTQITHIFDIIHNMSYRHGTVPKSMEGKIVQDADRLDALGAIGIARTFSFGGRKGRLLYDQNSKDGIDTRSHFYQKLFHLYDLLNTQKAKDLAVPKVAFMKEFLKQLEIEI